MPVIDAAWLLPVVAGIAVLGVAIGLHPNSRFLWLFRKWDEAIYGSPDQALVAFSRRSATLQAEIQEA